MDVSLGISRKRLFGETEIVEIPRKDWGPAWSEKPLTALQRCIWHLPYQVACRVPDGFELSFRCAVDRSGCRRFWPLPDTGTFLQFAGVLGHQLLQDRDEVRSDLPLTYNEYRLVGNYVRHTREYIGPTRRLEQTIRIAARGRGGPGPEEKDILPTDLGLDQRGDGTRWSPEQLMDEGLAAAKDAGVKDPSLNEIFVRGLTVAARRVPLELQDHEARSVTRTLLFSFGPSAFERSVAGDALKRESFEFVANEIKVVLKEHLEDSAEKFEEWMEDRNSNLIRRISKKKSCPTSRAGVRQIIAELGAQAVWLQGDGVDATMTAFQKSLPKPLVGYEAKLFDITYLKQLKFGGLPLVMLQDRFDFLSPAIQSIWSHPEDENEIRVFYRVATWFEEILEKIRAADRRRKPRRSHPVPAESDGTEILITSVDKRDALQSLIEARLECDLELSDWQVERISTDDESRTFRIICPDMTIDATLTFTLEDLSRLGYDDREDAGE